MMKKILMIVCALAMSATMFAQKGESGVGGGFKYMLDNNSNLGIGLKYQYGFTEKIRGEASFNYFLKKDHVSYWDVNANAQYLIPVGDFTIYPFAGLTIQGWKVDAGVGNVSDSDFGANLGVGAEYPLDDQWKINLDFTYKVVKDIDSPYLSLGVTYKF